MNKFILGGILAAISLMAIYGTSASNQVISRVDSTERPSSQSNFGQTTPTGTNTSGNTNTNSVVALNSTDTKDVKDDPFIDVSAKTPLEKAGTIPQRQTIGTTPNFGATPLTTGANDDTNGQVIEAPAQPVTQPPATTTTTPTAPATTPAPAEPIKALW